MKKIMTFMLTLLSVLTLGVTLHANAQTTGAEVQGSGIFYERVDSKSSLGDSEQVLIGTNSGRVAENYGSTRLYTPNVYTVKLNKIEYVDTMMLFTVKKQSNGNYTISFTDEKNATHYLGYKNSKTDLYDGKETKEWNLVDSKNGVEIQNTTAQSGKKIRQICLEGQSTYFRNYASGTKATLFKLAPVDNTISAIFNTQGVEFKADTVKEQESAAEATSLEVTLPAASDMVSTNLCLTFKGWTDGTTTYEAGSKVTIEKDTEFKAIFEARQDLNVAETIDLAMAIGESGNSFIYSTTGVVSSIDDKNSSFSITDPEGTEELKIYRPKTDYTLAKVGATVKITGHIKAFRGNEPEYDRPDFTVISEPAVPTFADMQTKSSLAITYDNETNVPSKINLRFGGIIDEALYDSTAEYGVIAIADPAETPLESFTAADIENLITSNFAIKCTPAKVEGGYQFAWVINNMEGHLNTKFRACMFMIKDGTVTLSKPLEVKTSVVDVVNAYKADTTLNAYTNVFDNILNIAKEELK